MMVGLGYPRAIASALEAWGFLSEYPGDTREKTTALAACRAVMEGRTVPETAHFALIKFAQKKDILLERSASVAGSCRRINAFLPAHRLARAVREA